MTAEGLKSTAKLNSLAKESGKRLDELTLVRGARDRVEGLVRPIVGHSVKALGTFINKSWTQLTDCFYA